MNDCFAYRPGGMIRCVALEEVEPGCGTSKCSFYKSQEAYTDECLRLANRTNKFVNTLQRLISEQGYTITTLANKSGVSYETIYKAVKRISKKLSKNSAEKLASVLGCEPEDITKL